MRLLQALIQLKSWSSTWNRSDGNLTWMTCTNLRGRCSERLLYTVENPEWIWTCWKRRWDCTAARHVTHRYLCERNWSGLILSTGRAVYWWSAVEATVLAAHSVATIVSVPPLKYQKNTMRFFSYDTGALGNHYRNLLQTLDWSTMKNVAVHAKEQQEVKSVWSLKAFTLQRIKP